FAQRTDFRLKPLSGTPGIVVDLAMLGFSLPCLAKPPFRFDRSALSFLGRMGGTLDREPEALALAVGTRLRHKGLPLLGDRGGLMVKTGDALMQIFDSPAGSGAPRCQIGEARICVVKCLLFPCQR